jgi:hypothetical protein
MISKAELSKYRALGDKEADEIINQIVDQNGISSLRQIMSFFSDYQNLSFENQSPILQLFLSANASLPVFYDKKKLIRSFARKFCESSCHHPFACADQYSN